MPAIPLAPLELTSSKDGRPRGIGGAVGGGGGGGGGSIPDTSLSEAVRDCLKCVDFLGLEGGSLGVAFGAGGNDDGIGGGPGGLSCGSGGADVGTGGVLLGKRGAVGGIDGGAMGETVVGAIGCTGGGDI